jgi:osmotically-inducible protein OsmY
MRLVLTTTFVLFLSGCSMVRFYFAQTEGISAAKLIPLYFQEQQYVNDQILAAKVRGALAQAPALRGADIEVDVYQSAVTLRGETASPAQTRTAVETARSVFGVESVTETLR